MKQEGRTELEMAESYCFLYPDKSKVVPKPTAQLEKEMCAVPISAEA